MSINPESFERIKLEAESIAAEQLGRDPEGEARRRMVASRADIVMGLVAIVAMVVGAVVLTLFF